MMVAKLLNLNRTVTNLIELNGQSSNGNLKKWSGFIGDKCIYIKTSSLSVGRLDYECEAECVSSRLAKMLGIPYVCQYYLDEMNLGSKVYKVCYSYDFVRGGVYKSYNSILPGISKKIGYDKYASVVGFNPYLRSYLDTILVFDSIIGNEDRHLRNIGVLRSVNGDMCIPLFDNGNSLFYNKNSTYIRNILRTSLDYLPCKPFFSTFKNQLVLCDFCNLYLRKVKRSDVYKLVNFYFKGERAKLIGKFLILRLMEYNLIWN